MWYGNFISVKLFYKNHHLWAWGRGGCVSNKDPIAGTAPQAGPGTLHPSPASPPSLFVEAASCSPLAWLWMPMDSDLRRGWGPRAQAGAPEDKVAHTAGDGHQPGDSRPGQTGAGRGGPNTELGGALSTWPSPCRPPLPGAPRPRRQARAGPSGFADPSILPAPGGFLSPLALLVLLTGGKWPNVGDSVRVGAQF